jgi:CHAT domain-containing protein/tetratricopeptide (TPR) repeat protein
MAPKPALAPRLICHGLNEKTLFLAITTVFLISASATVCFDSRVSADLLSSPANVVSNEALAGQTKAASNSEIRVLEQGKPIQRELAGGGVHSYSLTMSAGQYALIVVDQHGIDVAVTVFDPVGKKVLSVDSPNGPQGPEQVSLLAGVPGTYRVDLRAVESKAAPGRYEARIDQLRTATEQDKSRMAAQILFAEGVELVAPDTQESWKNSAAKFEEALSLWRAVGDKSREAETLGYMARAYFEMGDLKKSLEFYNTALASYRAIDYRAGEAVVLNDLGSVYDDLGDRKKALDYYNQSLAVKVGLGNRVGQATTLQNMALVYNYLGDNQKALDVNEQALALHREAGDQREEANTLLNIGALYSSLGDRQRALDYYNLSLPLQRAVGNKKEEATVLGNIGAAYQGLGEDRKALDYYERAFNLAQSVGGRRGGATWLNNMGAVLQNLGEYQQAYEHYSQALAMYEATSNLKGQALTLNNIGMYYKAIGDNQKALDYYDKALSMRRSMGDKEAEAFTLYNIAKLERDRGNLAEARGYISKTIATVESLRKNVASQQLRTSFFASVRKYHDFNIDLLMRLHKQRPSEGFDAAALHASEEGRARSLLDLLSEADVEIRQGVDQTLIERERSLRKMISDKADSQTRLLSVKHTDAEAAALASEINDLTADYERVQAQIRQSSPRYAELTQPRPLTLAQIQTEVLDDQTLLLEFALADDKSFLWAVTPGSIKSFELPKRLVIEQQARRVYASLTARNETVASETPEQRRRRLEQADSEYPVAAAELSQMLFGGVGPDLKGKRLLIVGDGMLQYLPFAALPEPAAISAVANQPPPKSEGSGSSKAAGRLPLIAEHEIVSIPSASVLPALRREVAGRKPADKTLAVFADPVFERSDPRVRSASETSAPAAKESRTTSDVTRSAAESGIRDFLRLRFTREEATQIVRLAGEGRKFEAIDFAASRETATNAQLSQYAILHFATHGLINNQHPELSGIVLSLVDEKGHPQNGFLRLYDIYNLKLRADLVVLSACQTALGKDIKGEGLVGLTRGFMYAGVPRVVATLWQIYDRATAEFMSRFYEAMLRDGLKPAAALRTAQISMFRDKRWQAPYYWAAFTLQGEWK